MEYFQESLLLTHISDNLFLLYCYQDMPVPYSVSGSPEKGGIGGNQGSDNRHATTGNQVSLWVVTIESFKCLLLLSALT